MGISVPLVPPGVHVEERQGDELAKHSQAYHHAFSTAWPTVDAAVGSMLSKHGCHAPQRQDVLQETALRLLTKQVAFTAADDLIPYALVVAKRIYIDDLRRRREFGDFAESAAEVPHPTDVATIVELRLALQCVLKAWADLTLDERRLLIGYQTTTDSRPLSSREKTQRHRLRARLKKTAGGLVVAALLMAIGPWAPHTPPSTAHRMSKPHPKVKQDRLRTDALRTHIHRT